MCRLATEDDPCLDVCEIELDRPVPSFTADTLRELNARHASDAFTLILGADTLAEMTAWRDISAILELSEVVAIPRPGYAAQLPAELLAKHPSAATRVQIAETAASDVSASDVRARLAAEGSITGLVPPAVARHIQSHGLYRRTQDVTGGPI